MNKFTFSSRRSTTSSWRASYCSTTSLYFNFNWYNYKSFNYSIFTSSSNDFTVLTFFSISLHCIFISVKASIVCLASLFILSTKLKDICNQYGVFILTGTQLSGDYRTAEIPDQSFLRGARSIADSIESSLKEILKIIRGWIARNP